MNPVQFWFAILSLFGFVVVAPAWLYFAGPAASGLPRETQFLVSLVLPMMLLLGFASWMDTA